MNTKNTIIILTILIAATFIAGMVLYSQFPDRVVSHWNAAGEADGYMGKFLGIFLLPLVMVGVFLIYFVIPKVDPLKANIEVFRKYYNALWIFIFAFFVYIFGLTLIWNLGYQFNFTIAIIPAMAVLWFFLGVFLGKLKRNWSVGIRTPWTISSDVVWEKTHKLGGRLFKIAAVISLFGLFFQGGIAFIMIIFPVIIVAVVAVIYSYVEYRKIEKGKIV